jgi:hypothetical protein
MNKLVHSYSLLLSDPDRYNYQARRDFGSYAPEIIEGRKTTEQDAQQTSQTNNVDNKLGDNKDTSTISAVNILLGASNGVRLGAFDDNFINASISGATLNNIDQCIDRAISKLENTNSMVNKVVMCLGTNDVSKCTVGSFIHSLRINLFTLVVVAFNIFVLLPVPFRGNIPQIPIKESGK